MLPTPDTSHVPYERVYEPSEDSFLLLDTLSSDSEKVFLRRTMAAQGQPAPLVVEVGTGSGVVLAFVHAHARDIFGTSRVLTAGVDVNAYACRATVATVRKAQQDVTASAAATAADLTEDPDASSRETGGTLHATYLGACMGDLTSPWRSNEIDVLIFNPPYVPTPELPTRPEGFADGDDAVPLPSFDVDSYLLALSYAGGRDGMETTDRLIASLPAILSLRGCAYVLLCAQNRPDEVKQRVLGFGPEWRALTVGSSGKTAGWEKLQVVRIWREESST